MKVLPEVLQAIENERGRSSNSLATLFSSLGMPPLSEWMLDDDGFYFFDRDAAPEFHTHWRDELWD